MIGITFNLHCVTWTSVVVLLVCATTLHAADVAETSIEFGRDIRPILSENCFKCHGPDEAARKAKLRLDVQQGAIAELKDGGFAIAPGRSAQSVLINRVTSDDDDWRMPPPSEHKRLTEEQIDRLKRWIDQGAEYREHWSFVAPQRPALPNVDRRNWARNSIDHFILARLEREGLEPSEPADKQTLIRRVTLDLTGMVATPEEADAFLADDSSNAYEKVVDRLLTSPRYGEHMTRYWLDAVRYADTHGFHFDNERSMWPYRDWVIGAFNDNMSFKQFTIEQLAGDLLPEPSVPQRVASGYNRCNPTTNEGGVIEDEYRVKYTVDRVETTATVWLGLTLGCAVCHDHKFDPISQAEFYQLFAYFNSTAEKVMDDNAMLPEPIVKVPSPEQAEKLAQLTEQIEAIRTTLDAPMPEVDEAQLVWQRQRHEHLAEQWQTLDPDTFTSTGGSTLRKLEDLSVLAEGENPDTDIYEVTAHTDRTGLTAIQLDVLTHESMLENGPGRADNANFILSEFELEIISLADPMQTQKVVFARAYVDHWEDDWGTIEDTIDGEVEQDNGWAGDGHQRHEDRIAYFYPADPFGFEGGSELRFRMHFASEYARHAFGRFRLAVSNDPAVGPVTLDDWHALGPFQAEDGQSPYNDDFGVEPKPDLAATYNDGTLAWAEAPQFEGGEVHELEGQNCATYLYRTIHSPDARKITLSLGSDDAIRIWANGEEVFARDVRRGVAPDQDNVTIDLQPGENDLLMKIVNYGGDYGFYFKAIDENFIAGLPLDMVRVLKVPEQQRTTEQQRQIRDYYRKDQSPQFQEIYAQSADLQQKHEQLEEQVPGTLIAQELDEPRPAYLLERGEYDRPKQQVFRGVPGSLPPMPADAPNNRLGFAMWLTDPGHPLTARVITNRYWQRYFGTGIVKTAEDFGVQGEWPTHPRLLDWLAVEFIESGWDVKHMQRLIVTSATYRQSSRFRPELQQIDPDNRWLARGPRFRMDAEIIRDNALAAGGLLVERLGGPSVKPYQPDGLWKAVGYTSSNTAQFQRDSGDALYRRSLYTFWKRTSPPPTMTTFDAPARETCRVRRSRTNTPLAALALMNDIQFVEAARALAQRIMLEAGPSPKHRVTLAFRIATGRRPDRGEVDVLLHLFNEQLAAYQRDKEAAAKLISVGESEADPALDASELAAWTVVTNMILNLDAAITKG